MFSYLRIGSAPCFSGRFGSHVSLAPDSLKLKFLYDGGIIAVAIKIRKLILLQYQPALTSRISQLGYCQNVGNQPYGYVRVRVVSILHPAY